MAGTEAEEWSGAEMEKIARLKDAHRRIESELRKIVVGQDKVVGLTMVGLFGQGHCLLMGVPGLGKTLLVRTLAESIRVKFSRIQFTPDLMPADVIGTNVVIETPDGGRQIRFQKGPLFGQVVLADEVNRATPKTQSALLEAMQELSVTVGGVSHLLMRPFFVLATQNPIEMEGTYPLPEAQLDRFFFKLKVSSPGLKELSEIIDQTTRPSQAEVQQVVNGEQVEAVKSLVREVVLAAAVKEYISRLVLSTHPDQAGAPEKVRRFVRYGSSPRGAQALALAGKVNALLDGRFNVAFEDVRSIAWPALRHRLILSFEGEAEGVDPDAILGDVLSHLDAQQPREGAI
jgi:MoxR-like ATPase